MNPTIFVTFDEVYTDESTFFDTVKVQCGMIHLTLPLPMYGNLPRHEAALQAATDMLAILVRYAPDLDEETTVVRPLYGGRGQGQGDGLFTFKVVTDETEYEPIPEELA